jgi:hypothetical protein
MASSRLSFNLRTRYLFNFATWLWWSFFFFHELSSHAYYAYLAALPDDGGRFVQILSPALVGTTIMAVIAILLALFFYVGAKAWRVRNLMLDVARRKSSNSFHRFAN